METSKFGYPFRAHYYCTLYTNFSSGSTDVVARHLSFAQITCHPSYTLKSSSYFLSFFPKSVNEVKKCMRVPR